MEIPEVYQVGADSTDSDFIGFRFNGKHSDDFNIKRVSEGSRYNENLLPTMQDKVVQIPGADGSYYFGSYYTQRNFIVQFAFDSLTEQNLRELKNWLGDKQIHSLIFDEHPYKEYKAKVTANSTIKHICFIENENRIYKGEGTIQFTCYDPFATLRKDINPWKEAYENFANYSEWSDTIDLLTQAEYYDIHREDIAKTSAHSGYKWVKSFVIYNPGDKECDFICSFKIPFNSANGSFWIGTDTDHYIEIKDFAKQNDSDVKIEVNSQNGLIRGIDNEGKYTGSIYNGHINKTIFKIPQTVDLGVNEKTFRINTNFDLTDKEAEAGGLDIKLEYWYKYF